MDNSLVQRLTEGRRRSSAPTICGEMHAFAFLPNSPHVAFSSPVLVRSASRSKRTNACRQRVCHLQHRWRHEMTLRPQESSWKEDRDLRAIESEFSGSTTKSVDSDLSVLKERITIIQRKEKQWREICQQFSAISFLTGIPMIREDDGEPTIVAWTFLFLSISVPVYMLYLLSDWLHTASISIGHMF